MGLLICLVPLILPCLLLPVGAAEKFDLRDGDRVVLLGGTLIEREQRYGYWETALTCRHPDRNVVFRNLGWSGDTVFGEARAGFGTPADGFQRLKEHVRAVEPTVIVVAYGANESFEGDAGVPRFCQGLDALLNTLAATKARIFFMAPLRHEDLGRPLPDPAAHNRDLQRYAQAVGEAAAKRGYLCVDINGEFKELPRQPRLTDNGIHLTAFGYWKTAFAFADRLGLAAPTWAVEITKEGKVASASGVRLTDYRAAPLRFQALDAILPSPPAPEGVPTDRNPGARLLRVAGLAPGNYGIQIDGKPVATASAAELTEGVRLLRGPEFEQAERLRAAIVEKNLLYFHRWRPQNETYLLGFRIYEQGKNAKELVQFDPLVAAKEKEIARLRVPVPHRYEILPQRDSGQ